MNNFQKVVKYCAMGFAALLAALIIYSIATALSAVFSLISGGAFSWKHIETTDFSQTYKRVDSLDISNAVGELIIKEGDSFKVEAENVSKNFKAKVTGNGKLQIRDTRNFKFLWFEFGPFKSSNAKIMVYLPSDFVADDVEIDMGAGTLYIEKLSTKELDISAGTGKVEGKNLTADKVKIEGGVGTVKLSNVHFSNVDFECGLGEFVVDGVLLGKIDLECGIGRVELNLKGDVNDYNFEVDSALGKILLNGERINKLRQKSKEADHRIRIEGGVGSVEIKMEE